VSQRCDFANAPASSRVRHSVAHPCGELRCNIAALARYTLTTTRGVVKRPKGCNACVAWAYMGVTHALRGWPRTATQGMSAAGLRSSMYALGLRAARTAQRNGPTAE
jgi:hypothetical protein